MRLENEKATLRGGLRLSYRLVLAAIRLRYQKTGPGSKRRRRSDLAAESMARWGCFVGLGVENLFSVHPGLHDLDVFDLIRRNLAWVFFQNDEIREFADLQAADLMVGKQLPGSF